MPTECRICELNAQAGDLPRRERLYADDHWRVSHGWSSLPGWLVVALRRHATALDALTADEAATLGPLLRAGSVALKHAVGCERTYVMLFAEHSLHPHVHIHLVPRMAWFGESERSGAVFRFLGVPEATQVPAEERERLAEEIGRTMREVLGQEAGAPHSPR